MQKGTKRNEQECIIWMFILVYVYRVCKFSDSYCLTLNLHGYVHILGDGMWL